MIKRQPTRKLYCFGCSTHIFTDVAYICCLLFSVLFFPYNQSSANKDLILFDFVIGCSNYKLVGLWTAWGLKSSGQGHRAQRVDKSSGDESCSLIGTVIINGLQPILEASNGKGLASMLDYRYWMTQIS